MKETHMADETTADTPLVQVYIENARNANIGGFTIPLPITKETLEPWLSAIEADTDGSNIAIKSLDSSAPYLEVALKGAVPVDGTGDVLDELNYLARLLAEMDEDDLGELFAAIESRGHCDSAADIINLAKNLGRIDLMPAFDEEAYGEYLIESFEYEDAYTRLKESQAPDDRALAGYIESLERHVDRESYGREAIEQGQGILTSAGLLFISGDIEELYRGAQDIPREFRLFGDSAPRLLKVTNVELAPFLAKLHAVAGEYPRDAGYNLKTLAALRSGEYLLLLDSQNAFLTEAAHVYKRRTTAFDIWTGASETPGTKAFSIHVTEVRDRIIGDVEELDLVQRQRDIISHSIHPAAVEATLRDGGTVEYAPAEWEGLPPQEKDRVESWRRQFRDEDYSGVHQHLAKISDGHSEAKAVSAYEFLVGINAAYMESARCTTTGFLRVSQETAKEILACGDAEVFHLSPEGATRLEQIDAVKSGLWFSEHREFAIRREDLPKLDGWAERTSAELLRQAERAGHQKSNELGL
jgi:hypothetical protein